MDLTTLSITEALKKLEVGEVTSLELVRALKKNIDAKNKDLNIYLEVFADVEEQAKAADEKRKRGEKGALLGIPLAIKDNILIEGRTASSASKILENYVATYDATAIRKLKEAGAVLIGRVNMDEFAMGGSTENSAYGPTKNPIDEARVPGGSSGGSAAAVAAHMALGALGSDTGGSIREPASFCGLVGLKGTYGSVSRHGLMAMGSSLDQIGPLTKTVEDAKIIFEVIRGADALDSTSIAPTTYPAKTPTKKIGVPRHLLKEGIDTDVLERFEAALQKLKSAGYEIVDITLPSAPLALAVYYIIMPAESSSNLARFDGVRYGLSKKGESLVEDYAVTKGEGFGAEVRRRIMLGTYVLSAGYYDAYYGKALAARAELTKEYSDALLNLDAIATPTAPTPATKIGEKSDPLSMYLIDVFTVTANFTGNPAVSVPMGVVSREGKELPVGLQLTGAHGDEKTLLAVASLA